MCLNPILIREKKFGRLLYVGCYHCIECQKQRQNAWRFRIENEMKRTAKVMFITLTYDNNSVPINSLGSQVFCNSHIRNFLKRMREDLRHHDTSFKYVITGEYGSKTKRPHYHGLFFFNKNIDVEFVKYYVNKHWCRYYGEVVDVDEPRSFAAVTSYILKYIIKEDYRDVVNVERDKVDKFRIHCSHNIGLNWLHTKEAVKYYQQSKAAKIRTSNVLIHGTAFNQQIQVPRYYRTKIGRETTEYDMQKIYGSQIITNIIRNEQEYNEYSSTSSYPLSFQEWLINVKPTHNDNINKRYRSRHRLMCNTD